MVLYSLYNASLMPAIGPNFFRSSCFSAAGHVLIEKNLLKGLLVSSYQV